MNIGRRKFVGGMAAVGAVAATANPISAALAGTGFTANVPAELKKGLADGSTIMRVSLVEIVSGRRMPVKDHATKILILHGNFDSPNKDDALLADPVSWDAERMMEVEGIRIFGGNVGGRPFQAFAWFSTAPVLQAGNTLTVNYTLTFCMDIMNEEHRDKPFRELMDESAKNKDRVNVHRPAAFGGFSG